MGLNESLRQLYLVDQQLRGLETRLDGARKDVRVQQIKLEQLQQQATELHDQLKQTQAHAANLENEVAAADQKINRLREQMNNVKTNKEYSAILVEVNTFKAERSKTEDKALQLIAQIDAYKAEYEAINKKLADQQKIKDLTDKHLAERQAEVGEQLEQLKSQRAAAAANVPPESLAIFERLAEANDGEAMAPVTEEDRRRMEYACGGCYMQIPIEKVNLLMTQDQMVRCPSCSRILFMEASLKEAMGAK